MILPSVDGISRSPVQQQDQAPASPQLPAGGGQSSPPPAATTDRVVVSAAASQQANVPRPADSGETPQIAAEAAVDRVHQLVETLSQRFTSVKFRIHDDYEELVVDVVGKDSGELIRQIPAEEILNMRAKMEELRGLLFSETS